MPDFPLAARVRTEPALARAAAVVLDGPPNAPYVAAATAEAAAAGIGPGQPLPRARALLPGLIVRMRDSLAERAAAQALREAAEEFSPRIESEGPGSVFLDAAAADEAGSLAEAMASRVRAAGLPGRVGLADSRAAARAAAESSRGAPVVVAPGGSAAFLAPLPLDRLRPSPALAARLERWGVKTAGALARLPPGEVSARLGAEGLALHRAARGEDERALVPEPPPARFLEGMSLDWPAAELEPFLRLAGEVLERLARRLASRGLACRKLEVTLELDPQGRDSRSLALAAPTRDAKAWALLLRLELGRRPPRAPVVGISAEAEPEEPRLAQLTLFGPPAPSPDKVATTLARLSALLGPGRVGAPRAPDTHRPESFEVAEYAPRPPAEPSGAAPEAVGRLALRVLRPRVALRVRLGAEGGPAWLRGGALAVEGEVRVASGPWRIEDGWWTEESLCRDYWDVELSDGGLYRVYREPAGAWFLDGIYD